MHITETTPAGVRLLHAQLPLVLLVEDDPACVRLLREALREREVHVRLMAAHDAAQAFGALRLVPQQSPPRLIILDLGLPGVRGHMLLREFGAHTAWSGVPKVILTSSEGARDREDAFALGAKDYFVKPSSIEGYLELADRLRSYL